MSKRSGYFLVYRDIWKNHVFKNLLQASCWIYFISSASHKDRTLKFLDNKIFVKRGEMVMPLRITAKRFGMTYSEMRSFILRLVRKNMITTRTNHLQPTKNHLNRKVTLISLVNYDKFQFISDEQPLTNHFKQQVLNNYTNELYNNIRSSKVVDKVIGTEGNYNILLLNGKKYLKHKFKQEPLKEY